MNPGAVITTLDDTLTMKVDFDVPEIFLSVLKAGLAVVAQSAAYAGESFNGEVESVDSRVDPVTRTIKVRYPEKLKEVHVGDMVELTYTEAIAITLEKAAKK